MEHDSDTSHDHRKWSVLPPHRRARSEALSQDRHPPDIPEDGEPPAIAVPGQRPGFASSPNSTPPKKTWERHFRSFLTKRGSHESPDVVSALDSTSSKVAVAHQVASSRSKFSLVPGSRRLLMRNCSDGSLPYVPSHAIAAAATLPKTKSSADMTVKGGSFFSHVFQKDTTKSPGRNISRKTKSMDTLDTSMRRGQDKAHSPKLLHPTSNHDVGSFVEPPFMPDGTMDTSSKGGSPLPLHPRSPEKGRNSPPSNLSKALRPTNQVPRHPGSPKAREPESLPASLVSSAKTQATTEIKKAFTEFHNSPAFAKDSTSAYLGDDSSVSGNSHFAMYNKAAAHSKGGKLRFAGIGMFTFFAGSHCC